MSLFVMLSNNDVCSRSEVSDDKDLADEDFVFPMSGNTLPISRFRARSKVIPSERRLWSAERKACSP